MKRYNLFWSVVLMAILEIISVKCKAQSYIPLDWETTRGLSVSYDFSKEYLLSVSCFGTPYWGEGKYYHSFGIGFPRSYKNVLYNVSVPDTLITKMTIINGDTTQFSFMQIHRDTTIADYSYGYVYYEPGINLSRYLTVACKIGFSCTSNEKVYSGTPAYDSDITVISPTGYYHHSSSHSATSGQTWKNYNWGMLFAPSIIGHFPVSDDLRLTAIVGYNWFVPLTPLESPKKANGLRIGVGLEFVLD